MFLTDEEKRRFLEYLDREMHDANLIAEKTSKLPGMEMLAKKLRTEAMAHKIVADRIRSFESMTISGDGT
jgi:hypothetical protein